MSKLKPNKDGTIETLQHAVSKWEELGFDVAANAFAEKLSEVEKEGRVVCLSFDMNEGVKEILANSMFGKRNSPNECVRCHKVPEGFKDKVSEKEWRITGFCQDCQDFVFNVSEEYSDE